MSGSQKSNSLLQRVGKMYALFEKYFPDHRSKQGVLDIQRLALEMGYSNETLYKSFRNDKLSPTVALDILRFSHEQHPEQPLHWEDLAQFVLPEFEKFSTTSADD